MANRLHMAVFIAVVVPVLASSCAKPVAIPAMPAPVPEDPAAPPVDPSLPIWLRERIAGYQQSTFRSSPLRVMKFKHGWQTYYYFSGLCCEQLNPITDDDGDYVCAPTGGWTGDGDNKCPKSFPDEEGMTTVWEDSRLH